MSEDDLNVSNKSALFHVVKNYFCLLKKDVNTSIKVKEHTVIGRNWAIFKFSSVGRDQEFAYVPFYIDSGKTGICSHTHYWSCTSTLRVDINSNKAETI